MTGKTMLDPMELFGKVEGKAGVEFLRELLQPVLQSLLEAERDKHCGAGRHERVHQSVLTMTFEMCARGVSARKVRALLERTLGTGISAETVSRANQSLDTVIGALRKRLLVLVEAFVAEEELGAVAAAQIAVGEHPGASARRRRWQGLRREQPGLPPIQRAPRMGSGLGFSCL